MASQKPNCACGAFFSPSAHGAETRFQVNLAAAIAGDRKIIVRGCGVEQYDLLSDKDECQPVPGSIRAFIDDGRRDGIAETALASAATYLQGRENGHRYSHFQASTSVDPIAGTLPH
jgi:hypothetical protein